MVFVSGQIPVDPATGNMPEGVEAQAVQALTNLKNVLAAAGLGMENVVKKWVVSASWKMVAITVAAYLLEQLGLLAASWLHAPE